MAYRCNRALPHSHTTEPKELGHYITVCKRHGYSAMSESERASEEQLPGEPGRELTANGQMREREDHGSRSEWQK